MKMLDLFCGAGGAAVGYYRAGFLDITGIDIKPQRNYPFKMIQYDALDYLSLRGEEFDFIHASPPCQRYTEMQRVHKNEENHPDLIEPTRSALIELGKPYVIENVKGAPLIDAVMLCGTYFGLNIARHRYFESSIDLFEIHPPCNHKGLYSKWRWEDKSNPDNWRDERGKLSAAMGVDWFMTRPEVREAIPPAYTEHLGKKIRMAI